MLKSIKQILQGILMIIKNGIIITWGTPNQILTGFGILIQQGTIQDIRPIAELVRLFPEEPLFDAGGQLIMPGNICGHTHFYGAFARGMATAGAPPKQFCEILQKLWWGLDKSLTHEDVYYSAVVCLIDAIRHGTTCLFDHHASPSAIEGSLEQIAIAVEQSGLRASLCYEVTDRDGEEKSEQGIRENVNYINYIKQSKPAQGRLHAMFGLHASFTVSQRTLEKCRSVVPDEVGFHFHLAEDLIDQFDSLDLYGERITERFYKAGILGKNSIAAHGVHIDPVEMELLAETSTWVTHQPRSNMNNAVGVAAVESMARMGVRVCIGNDGFSNAMWEEWKTAYLLQKIYHRDPRRMNGNELINMAVYNNSKLATHMFGKTIGRIEIGAAADLIIVDYHPFTPLDENNLAWHILFGFHESMITTTMVNGRFLMKNRELLTLDEEKITSVARNRAPIIWQRYKNQFKKEVGN